MTPNLPVWRGETPFYEIWFAVVIEQASRRATWVRYTLYSGEGGARATLWAAAFDGDGEPIAEKKIAGIDVFDRGPDDRFAVRIGDAEIGHGYIRGSIDRLAWDLRFTPAAAPAVRTPRLANRLPLPTKAVHANADVPFSGTVTVDGKARALEGAVGTQMHIWGTRRVEELAWAWDPNAKIEIVSAGPSTSVLVGDLDLTQPPAALLAKRRVLRESAALDVRARGGMRLVRARAFCDPRTLVGYVYRDPSGRDLAVAQSDVATCHVEVFRRRATGLVPERVIVTRGASALEIHGPEPLAGVSYIPWDETERPPSPRSRRTAATSELPKLGRIVALGLTYRDHVRETSSTPELAAFEKHAKTFLPEGEWVTSPSSDEILAALDVAEPGLASALRDRFAFVPAILDYEVELAMVVLAGGRVGWTIANDVTARSCQVLGEGAADPMTFWAVAKSFPGFLPIGPRLFVSDTIPVTTLTTRVNGEVRQRSSTTELMYDKDRIVARAGLVLGRPLAEGDIVLTGTPAGVAFHVSPLKRKLGATLLSRFGRLAAVIGGYAKSDAFLRPGDVVEVDGGVLGARRVTIRA